MNIALQVSLTEESGTEYFKKEPQVGAPANPILSDPILSDLIRSNLIRSGPIPTVTRTDSHSHRVPARLLTARLEAAAA